VKPFILEANPNLPAQVQSKFILLGEDDIDDQEFLEEALMSIDRSNRFKAVTNGKHLISYLEEQHRHGLPDLIVLDYNLPLLNGAEILRLLKNDKRFMKIPAIVWSTSKSPSCKADCLQIGASEYIVKPTDMASFKEIAAYMLTFCKT
jgi:CheY-like chemotaxis protein